MLTCFFSTRGLEEAGDGDLAGLLVREGVLRFTGARGYVSAAKVLDASGNEM